MARVNQVDVDVIRGDIFAMDVGFDERWTEIGEDPAGFVGKMVFRDDQDDSLTPHLTLQATPEPVVNPKIGAPQVYMAFTASAAQTQSLPPDNIVGYVEVSPVASPDESRRLFNMKVRMAD